MVGGRDRGRDGGREGECEWEVNKEGVLAVTVNMKDKVWYQEPG